MIREVVDMNFQFHFFFGYIFRGLGIERTNDISFSKSSNLIIYLHNKHLSFYFYHSGDVLWWGCVLVT